MFFAIKRLENETEKAYKAFEIYYSLKKERTRKKTSLILGHKNSYTCDKWSQSYNWDHRILEFENKLIQDVYDKSLEKIVKINDKVILAWEQVVNEIIRRISTKPEEMKNLSLNSLYNILNNASKHIIVLNKENLDIASTKINNVKVDEVEHIGEDLINGVLNDIQAISQD
jgi:hypothetical protein